MRGMDLWRDLRHAARRLGKDPGFTAGVVLQIALGVGLSTSVYNLAHDVLLRPVPIPSPHRVFEVAGPAAYPDYLDFRARSGAFCSGLLAYEITDLVLGPVGGEPVLGALVSDNYFDVLGARMALGRGFVAAEAQPANSLVAVLGHGFWRSRFGADPRVVGSRFQLEGEMFTIVGVAAEGFRGTVLGSPVEIWVPIAVYPRLSPAGDDLFYGRRSRWLQMAGRLRDGISPAQAEAAARAISSQLAAEFPDATVDPIDASLIPLGVAATGQRPRADFVRFLGMLAGVAAATLLLMCANLANLLSIRSVQRGKEMAVRLALGAARGALLRQLLVENLLLALLGGAVALPIAAGFLRLVRAFELPGKIPIESLGLGLTPQVSLFAGALALFTVLLFGTAPALSAVRRDPGRELTQHSASADRGAARLRGVLVTVQVALALLLLITGGLFAKTLRNGFSQDLGFASGELAVLRVRLGSDRYAGPRVAAFYADLVERLAILPGVRSASQVDVLPLGGSHWRVNPVIGGRYIKQRVHFNLVGTNYFETLGIPLVRGRTFDARDGREAASVGIVNETMARLYFPGEDPVGKQVTVFDDLALEIVGVVKDSVYYELASPPTPFLFVPYSQGFGSNRLSRFLMVRTTDPAGVLSRLRSALHAVDPEVEPVALDVFKSYVAAVLMPQRFGLRVLGAFGLLALVLACVGIYNVVAYTVETRRREIAIRRALGATDGSIVRLVSAQVFPPILAGVAAGLLAALWAGRFFASFLYGIDAANPATFAEVSVLLLVLALGAACLPAFRVRRRNVMAELRDE